jgi:hypothetical protein
MIPKWFPVALLVSVFAPIILATGASAAPLTLEQDFVVTLPEKEQPVPEPLPEGKRPGFALRGTKGWLWKPEQYLAEVPILAQYKMNFMMICYGSMCDIEHYAWRDPQCNRWWEPLPEPKKMAYEEVFRACKGRGIELCLSVNPNLGATRIFNYADSKDLDALWQHYAWMQALGMKWFCVCLDDISRGIDPAGQAKLVNALFVRLRANNPEAQMIFCPSYYSGDGSARDARAYLKTLAHDLDKEVYLFWTGDGVITSRITRRAAEAYRKVAQHRLILWDNYPVNDGNPTLHLGPVSGRDPDLCDVCEGYMSNPMHSENELNRLPLITCADYAYNPWAYDPRRSIGQAIVHIACQDSQRQVLKDLVELYPGMLLYGKGTKWNPAVARLDELLKAPHERYLTRLYFEHVCTVVSRFGAEFPGKYEAEKKTLNVNLDRMRKAYRSKYGEGF